MIGVSESRLANGLRLVTIEQPHLHSACVSLTVRCGSRHEELSQWGLSHLVEHMLFRGSARFPDTRQLARAFERYGGTVQAATWRDHTQLWTPIHPSRLLDAVAVLGDMTAHPRFSGLELERQIVEEELQEDLDEEGCDTDINNMSRASIWHNHPMGRRIAGSFESLHSFGVEQVREHHARHYVAGNAVLCIAGRVRAEDVERLAAISFADMPAGGPAGDGAAAHFAPGEPLCLRQRDGTQLDVQITFEALPDRHQDFAALELMTRVLDDGASSRLQQAICEREGLVYELSTGLDCYSDCGLYDVQMKVAPRRAASAIAAALDALADLCTNGVTEEEFEVVRERIRTEIEFSIDSSEDLANHYGAAALFGPLPTIERRLDDLAALRPENVLQVARRTFLGGRLHATLMGPVERAAMKRIEKLLADWPPPK
jgi:predicted Zn-dependent peptidase